MTSVMYNYTTTLKLIKLIIIFHLDFFSEQFHESCFYLCVAALSIKYHHTQDKPVPNYCILICNAKTD